MSLNWNTAARNSLFTTTQRNGSLTEVKEERPETLSESVRDYDIAINLITNIKCEYGSLRFCIFQIQPVKISGPFEPLAVWECGESEAPFSGGMLARH